MVDVLHSKKRNEMKNDGRPSLVFGSSRIRNRFDPTLCSILDVEGLV